MSGGPGVRMQFWGVRGSIPTPGAEYTGFGGNTACLQLIAGGETLVIDGGSGMRDLGKNMMQDAGAKINVVFTHFHWDHIQGLPFFAPLYQAEREVTLHSSLAEDDLRCVMNGQMKTPYFPVPYDALPAASRLVRLGKTERIGETTLHSFPLNHPQGATGFRIEVGGKTLVHASDTEHGDAAADSTIREFSNGADVLIYDAQYTPEEYESRRGWGHSTWLEGTRIARECGVKRLVLFHHDPAHTDEHLMALEREAQAEFEHTDLAREGQALYL